MNRTSIGLMGLALAALVSASIVASPIASTAAPSPTVVSIQFDDGNANQYAALAILNTYGMHATFYVNSGVIDDPTHLSWTQLADLAAANNEIASHTLLHTNIKKLKTAAARQAVCGDRVNLFNHGFQPVSFAYPFGSFDAGSEAVVQACGFNSGRGVAGSERQAGLRRDDPVPRRIRDPDPAEPEAGHHARDDRGLRHRGRGARRRMGAAGVPQHLHRLRRLLDNAGRFHVAARVVADASAGRGRRRNHCASDRRSGPTARATLSWVGRA